MPIPVGKLVVEAYMVNPPKPIGYHVIVDRQVVATLDHDEVKRVYEQYEALTKGHRK